MIFLGGTYEKRAFECLVYQSIVATQHALAKMLEGVRQHTAFRWGWGSCGKQCMPEYMQPNGIGGVTTDSPWHATHRRQGSAENLQATGREREREGMAAVQREGVKA